METRLPDPPAEMSQMEWFLGNWDVVSRYLDENDAWIEESIKTEHSLILGGNVVFELFGGPLFGKPFEAWSLRKFNPDLGKWEQRWVDTSPGGFADWTGSWHQDTATFVGNPNRSLEPDGTLAQEAAREVFFDITPGSFSWAYERTADRGVTWKAVWTLSYQRAE